MQYEADVLIFITFGIWLLIITGVLLWIFNFFRKLSSTVDEKSLIKVLDKVLDKEKENTKELSGLRSELERIEEEGLSHVQKIGFVRFNPFKELGGDHSFTVALLDGNNNGFILTGLHTRERTRVYTKDIKNGKSKLELSKEEQKALQKAVDKIWDE